MMSYKAALAIANMIPHTTVVPIDYNSNRFLVLNLDRSSADIDSLIEELSFKSCAQGQTALKLDDSDEDFLEEESHYYDPTIDSDCTQKQIYDDWSDASNMDWSVSFDDRGPGDWEDMIEDPTESLQEPGWCGMDISEAWADPHFGLYENGNYLP